MNTIKMSGTTRVHSRGAMMGLGRRVWLVVCLTAIALLSACGSQQDEPQAPEESALNIESIVVLGDSVAAGEGINYDYQYYYNDFSNLISHWRGGTDEPTWEEPYPLCHDSKQAYGNIVAEQLGAKLANFACTGATYENGIIAARTEQEEEYRPAEFGNWATQEFLNAEYDAAAPDVVIITLGADDVSFVDIVTFCMTGYSAKEADMVERMSADDGKGEIKENFVSRHAKQDVLEGDKTARITRSNSSYCTAENPGKPIQTLFWDPIQNGTIAANYQALVSAIQERGAKAGKVPHIVFTTYHNPMPQPEQPIDCFDLGDLDRDEINYLNTLQDTLNDTIKSAVGDLPGVSIADISGVMDKNKWCSPQPWTYGMTVLISNPDSKAPFHPTPEGQQAIAEIVKAAVMNSSSDEEREQIAQSILGVESPESAPDTEAVEEAVEATGDTTQEALENVQNEVTEGVESIMDAEPVDEALEAADEQLEEAEATIEPGVEEALDQASDAASEAASSDSVEAASEALESAAEEVEEANDNN